MVGVLPKNNVDLLLMSVLRRSPAHGYAIVAELRERSNGEFDLAEGTIYPALHRLEGLGFIEGAVEVVQGRRRRIYALTARGRAALSREQKAWQVYAANMQAVMA